MLKGGKQSRILKCEVRVEVKVTYVVGTGDGGHTVGGDEHVRALS